MSNYERDIRPKLDIIYIAAQQGDFQTSLDEMNKPFTGIHPLRVPFEVLRIADSQGNKEAALPFIDRIHAYKPFDDITGQTSLKITFISEVAKEQSNHAELYSIDDVAETLVRGINTFQEAQINTNDYLYGQQQGINRK